jgi:1-aminocyclopropane-1-carboxylate deaminase/D-cysteine desulfhydrase-like pyridoxal-dependent ACC family enzyme
LGARDAAFPRSGLAQLPTALEPIKRLTAYLGGPQLWVKREDATGLGFGGNKLRKLDYVLHQAISRGTDTIVSGGVVQSNSQAASCNVGIRNLGQRLSQSTLWRAGLIALIRNGGWATDEDVVFVHTGGALVLFAYQSALRV